MRNLILDEGTGFSGSIKIHLHPVFHLPQNVPVFAGFDFQRNFLPPEVMFLFFLSRMTDLQPATKQVR